MLVRVFYTLCLLSVVYASVVSQNNNGLHARSNYPNLQTLMVGKSKILSTQLDIHSVTSGSNNIGTGLTYLEFYRENNCGGGVTYSTGYRAGFCLPAIDYVRPPFTNDDDFQDSYPFQSLKISNVTTACNDWYITYYKDAYCTTVYSVERTDNYSDCRPAGSLLVSSLVSVRGKCTLTPNVPVLASSYIVSDYTGKDGCSEQELVSYTAYSTDTCFGYISGNSSTLFTANVTANTVQETQFYHNTKCECSTESADQSDYTISTANACNAVQTPGYPVEDDAVAVTEYIGVALVVMAPSLAPTARPSAVPTHKPTSVPTVSPTLNDFVNFAAQQVISGIDIATYNSNVTLYSYTLRESIAACMNGVGPENIIALVVSSASSAEASTSLRSVFATSASINIAYQVSVYGSSLSYQILSQQLSDSVSIGTFTTILHSFALESGALGFVTASSNSVSTQDLLASDNGSSKKGLGAGVIAGIVIGAVAFVVLLYLYKRRADKRNEELTATSSAPATTEVTAVTNPIATAEK